MLDRNEIFGLVTHRGCSQRLVGRAARLRRREHGLDRICGSLCRDGRVALAIHVRHMRFLVVFHPDQRRRKSRDLRRFGDDQRDRLAVELDLVIVKRPKR